MNKYFALLKSFFISAMIKRADFFGNIAVNLIQIAAAIVLWLAIYNPKESINGYTLQDTVVYYVFILLITYATTTNTADYVAQNIKSGTLSEWLLRPRSILLSEISRSFGDQLYRLFVLIPIYVVIIVAISIFPTGVQMSFGSIILGTLFIMLGFLLNCLFEYTLSMFAFWLVEVWSIKHFKVVITDLLGGKRVPLAFFPVAIQSINKFLPFQFIYFIPLEYILSKHTVKVDLAQDLFFVFSWIIIFGSRIL